MYIYSNGMVHTPLNEDRSSKLSVLHYEIYELPQPSKGGKSETRQFIPL